MKFMSRSSAVFSLLGILTLLLGGLIAGCGSADGLSVAPAQTGTVAILLTDGPTDEFSAVNVTVNEISLFSDAGGAVVIFSGSRRINLLALQEVEDLFTITEGVPVGVYGKIRLKISEPEFVRTDGQTITSNQIHLVAEGKVDLVLEHPIRVFPDETLIIRLDLDAEKSILIHVSDANGLIFQFRPVIFVEVLHDLHARLASVRGEVVSIDPETHTFLLKRSPPIFHILNVEDKPVLDHQEEDDVISEDRDDADDLDLDDEDHFRLHLIRVEVTDETHIFKASGQPGDFDSLAVGQHVHVRGLLTWEDGLFLKAKLIEIGEFIRLHGEITTGINAEKRFGFTPDPGQGVTGEILVQIHNETFIFEAGTHRRLDPEDLVAGKRVLIEGVLDVGVEPDLLLAAVIVVKPPEAKVTHLQGVISDLNPETRTFTLAEGPLCAFSDEPPCMVPLRIIAVHAMPDALILRVQSEKNNGEGDNHLGIELIPFDALKNGDEVHVFGQFDPSGSPFHAKVVLVEGSSGL